MHAIDAASVRTGPRYEAERQGAREALALAQAGRRVSLADDVVMVFESTETVRSALEERLRVDRTSDEAAVAAAVAVFNDVIPAPRHLLATVYIDVADALGLEERSVALGGLTEGISLDVAGVSVAATAPDADDTGAGAMSVIFALTGEQFDAWTDGPVTVAVDHPALRAQVVLASHQREAIAADLASNR